MVDRNAAFRQHFLKVAIADRIATIPAHRPQDHITLEMAPLEIRHRSVRPISAKHAQASRFLQQSLPWDTFAASVTEAQTLARPADFDFLHHIGESYATLRRYAPQFLGVLKLRAAPAAKGVLDAIDMLRGMNSDSARKVPADAPTAFIKD
ncbi:TnpA [Laribacter hongkongensis]|uniref:TnpA n=1 Tax=Laribacter hongkongensis TaxID=168471 RepID=A0A248LNL2_9NEIS|nr:TnpA [Laribacter hongkongensis]